jgi:hypothetical protein
MLNREEMLNEIIRKRGFEDEYTIEFARMAETIINIDILRLAFAVMIAMPVMDEEE